MTASVPASSAFPDPPFLDGCRVLIIESDQDVVTGLTHALMDNGAEVIGPLTHYRDALSQVRCDGVEVAVLDIDLDRRDGIRIADDLLRQAVPFVVVTADPGARLPRRFARVSVRHKPIEEQAVIREVARLYRTAARAVPQGDPVIPCARSERIPPSPAATA